MAGTPCDVPVPRNVSCIGAEAKGRSHVEGARAATPDGTHAQPPLVTRLTLRSGRVVPPYLIPRLRHSPVPGFANHQMP